MSQYRACISGLGFYVPEKILSNADLEKMVDTTDEWITSRTGIKERRIAARGTPASDLGAKAALAAIKNANISPSEIDLVIAATITPDMLFPSTACAIQNIIGAECGAFDIAAACSGFPYAIAIAEGFISTGAYQNILVIGTEVLSGFIDWKDRSTCVLFGDGAGAAIISRAANGHGVLASYLGADGSQGGILKIPGGGSANPPSAETLAQGMHFLKMEGAEVFKVAVRTMELSVNEVLRRGSISIDQVSWIIPHQANSRILHAVAERLKFPKEKVFINVERYGNMSSASTAVALVEAVEAGHVKRGDYIVLVAFGGGLTWAATLIKW